MNTHSLARLLPTVHDHAILVFSEIPKSPAIATCITAHMGINDTFKALADPTRREILRLLRDRDLTAGEIADQFDLSRPTMSGHFNVLKAAGLIVSERNRNSIVYSINSSAFEDALGSVLGLFRGKEQADSDIDAADENAGTGGK